MQVKIFTISVTDDGSSLEEMNVFLRGHKVLDMAQHFFSSENGGGWCYSIRYLGKAAAPLVGSFSQREKIDYMQVLDSDIFAIFAKMREVRKEIANTDGILPYAIFTDAELSNLAQLPELTLAAMQTVKGVGEKKVARFGERLIQLYKAKL